MLDVSSSNTARGGGPRRTDNSFLTHAVVFTGLVFVASALGCKRPDAVPGGEMGSTMASLNDTNVHGKCLMRMDSLNRDRSFNKPDGSVLLADEKLRLKLCDFTGSKEPQSTAPVDCYKRAIKENATESAAVEKCRPK